LLYQHTRALAEEMHHAARAGGRDSIQLRFVDVYKDLSAARELARKYSAEQPNLVIVASEDRHRLLVPSDLMEFQRGEPVAFRGEQALTSAILEVGDEKPPIIYWLDGVGTMRLDDTSPVRGLSEIASEMEARNIVLRPLDLSRTQRIPEDADLVILAGPRGPMGGLEADALRAYLENEAGRLVVLLELGSSTGLEELFYTWGVQSPDLLVIDPLSAQTTRGGEFLVRHFVEHPLTEVLIRNSAPLVGGFWRPVREHPASPIDERRQITPLLASPPESWGETQWRELNKAPTFDEGPDWRGPLTLAVLAERRDSGQLGISIPGGRLLVFGSASWIANRHINSFANHTLWLSTVQWMLERDHLLALPPRPLQRYQLAFNDEDFRRLALVFLGPPGFLLLLGAIVLLFRRAV
jgi:hypothetical protein